MLSVPMWARFMYAANGDLPLEEIPWQRPDKVKANDTGGALKQPYPPPPLAGVGPDGKPLALPATYQGQPVKTGAPPPTLVRQKVIRVQSAQPRPPKPGESPAVPVNAPEAPRP